MNDEDYGLSANSDLPIRNSSKIPLGDFAGFLWAVFQLALMFGVPIGIAVILSGWAVLRVFRFLLLGIALLLAAPLHARAGEYTYDIYVRDVALLEHIVSPPQQKAMLGETLPPRFKPANLVKLIRACEPRVWCDSQAGLRHQWGVGYHAAGVTLGRPQVLHSKLLAFTKDIQLWRCEGDRVHVYATCRIDVGILERIPIVRRIVDRIAAGVVLVGERALIEGLIAKARRERGNVLIVEPQVVERQPEPRRGQVRRLFRRGR